MTPILPLHHCILYTRCGAPVLVDPDVFERFQDASLYLSTSSGKSRKTILIYLYLEDKTEVFARVIMRKWLRGAKVVDHISGDTLDCRRVNMRVCTATQNAWNSSKRRNNKVGFKGVCKASKNRFRATIRCKGRYYLLGCFKTAQEAAKAYNQAAIKFFGEYARPNVI